MTTDVKQQRHEAGMVTAEFAVALPALVLVAVLCASVLLQAVSTLTAGDAARAAARALARHASEDAATVAAQAILPGAAVEVTRESDIVLVIVTGPRPRALPGLGNVLPAPRATARAPWEPTSP